MKKILIILLVIFLLFNAITLMVGNPNPTRQEKGDNEDSNSNGYKNEIVACVLDSYMGTGAWVTVYGDKYVCVDGASPTCTISICM